METRIIFNGHEYSGPEQMPEDIRKAFQERLAQLTTDSDQNGVPDALEGRGDVLGIQQSSITINGRTIENIRDLPAPLRWLVGSLLEYTTRQAAVTTAVSELPPEKQRWIKSLDAATNILGTLLHVLSAFLAGGLITFGIWMIVHMDASSRSEGAAFYIGIGVLVAIAWLVGILISLVSGWKRRGER
jgi:hypothetical protein